MHACMRAVLIMLWGPARYEAYISGLRGANGALTGPEEAEGGVAAGDAQMGAFNGMCALKGRVRSVDFIVRNVVSATCRVR